MKWLSLPLLLSLVAIGCGHGYLVEFDEVVRVSKLTENTLAKHTVTAVRADPPGTAEAPAAPVLVRADRLDWQQGKWLDSKRMRVSANRPWVSIVGGGLFLGVGIALGTLAGVIGSDHSCGQMTNHGDFSGIKCLDRNLKTIFAGISGGVIGFGGMIVLSVAAARWSPEVEK
jgi:hypothetical protein